MPSFTRLCPRCQAGTACARLLHQFFAENWKDPYDFEVDTYMDITDVYEQWIAAAEQYELFRGSISSFRYMDYYKALAGDAGCLAAASMPWA